MKKSRAILPFAVIAILFGSYNNCSPAKPADGTLTTKSNTSPTGGSTLPAPAPLPVGTPKIAGFSGWQTNGVATADADNATLTDGNNSEASSIFRPTPVNFSQPITVQFLYQDATATENDADGVTFTIQNSTDGVSALGGGGGALGYLGIGNSVALALDIYTRSAIALATDGNGYDYVDTSPVDLRSGNQISVYITYDPGTQVMDVTLQDTATLDTFQTNYTVDLSQHLGGSSGYVGFTGGTGGAVSTQIISGFSLDY